MLNNNFYAIMARIPSDSDSFSPDVGFINGIMITAIDGNRMFLSGYTYSSYFPGNKFFNPTTYPTQNGVRVGTGTTPPTVNDWKLENQITSGITLALASRTGIIDEHGNPSMLLVYSVKNNTAQPIAVSEIGWVVTVYTSNVPGVHQYTNSNILIDRTLLDEPITIAAGETGLINYVIHTTYFQPKTVAGVEIVPFTYGTDEQIVAMIQAARAGTINLQTDAGWQIGDSRAISVGAVGSYDAHTGYVFISSFEEYEGCGNVLQLDMAYNYLRSGMNSSASSAGGYGSSYMYSTFLPSVEAAFPSWLRGLLRTFNVKASNGNSDEILTVPNNKIALRSEVEVFGTTTYSYAGEGQRQEAFKRTPYLYKIVSGASGNRWLRSTHHSQRFAVASNNSTVNESTATTTSFIAPFMCV